MTGHSRLVVAAALAGNYERAAREATNEEIEEKLGLTREQLGIYGDVEPQAFLSVVSALIGEIENIPKRGRGRPRKKVLENKDSRRAWIVACFALQLGLNQRKTIDHLVTLSRFMKFVTENPLFIEKLQLLAQFNEAGEGLSPTEANQIKARAAAHAIGLRIIEATTTERQCFDELVSLFSPYRGNIEASVSRGNRNFADNNINLKRKMSEALSRLSKNTEIFESSSLLSGS